MKQFLDIKKNEVNSTHSVHRKKTKIVLLQLPQVSEHTSQHIIPVIQPRALQPAHFPPSSLRHNHACQHHWRQKQFFPAGVVALRSVRQLNTPADPTAHPSLCHSSASCRSSRFSFLEVSVPWLQITSATLRWSVGMRPSGWNDRRWRQVEAMQAPTNTHTCTPWSHATCIWSWSADRPVWWSAVTAIVTLTPSTTLQWRTP